MSNQCQSIPNPNLPPDPTSAGELFAASGLKSCSTSNSALQLSGSMNVTPFASASFSGAASTSSTNGCENFTSISNTYKNSLKNISCQIKKSSVNVESKFKAINNIQIGDTNTENTTISNTTIRQIAKINVTNSVSITQSMKNNISNSVKSTAKALVKATQKSWAGQGATPTGAKIFVDTNTQIDNMNLDTSITESVVSVKLSAVGANTIKIFGKNISMEGVKIDQDVVLNVIAKTVLNNALADTLTNFTTIINSSSVTASQEQTSLGNESLAKQGIMPPSTTMTTIIIVVGAIVCLMVVGGMVLGISKTGGAPKQPTMKFT
jgi:hypothetical protein